MNVDLPYEIGVTGGIGSGKSLVCKIFSILGVPVYDADRRAKWLTNHDPAIREQLIKEFGPQAYNQLGLDRDYIAGLVFKDPQKLQRLNEVIHPRVGIDYDQWVKTHSTPYVIKEAALIFEAGSYKRLHQVINVSAPEAIRIARVLRRDPFRQEDEIREIISKQISEAERQKRADYTVLNDEKEMLIPQILKLHEHFLEEFEK